MLIPFGITFLWTPHGISLNMKSISLNSLAPCEQFFVERSIAVHRCAYEFLFISRVVRHRRLLNHFFFLFRIYRRRRWRRRHLLNWQRVHMISAARRHTTTSPHRIALNSLWEWKILECIFPWIDNDAARRLMCAGAIGVRCVWVLNQMHNRFSNFNHMFASISDDSATERRERDEKITLLFIRHVCFVHWKLSFFAEISSHLMHWYDFSSIASFKCSTTSASFFSLV